MHLVYRVLENETEGILQERTSKLMNNERKEDNSRSVIKYTTY